jgi:hypothetical protein
VGNPSKTIILAGSGRSGTTWLGDIIAADWRFRIIFEPFDARKVPEAKAAGISLRPYCSPQESCLDLYHFTQRVLAGKVRNPWVDQQGRRPWAWRLLLKTIRTTLLLGWMDEQFHPPIVYLIRHPGAVVASRRRLGWETHLDVLLAQPNLMRDYLGPVKQIIEAARTEVQKQAVMWCVENMVPLNQLAHYPWLFCTYEHLYQEPEKEAGRLLRDLGLKETPARRRAIHKLSHVTQEQSALKTGKDVLTAWQQEFSAQEVADMAAILCSFGLDLYSFESPLPNPDVYLRLQKKG